MTMPLTLVTSSSDGPNSNGAAYRPGSRESDLLNFVTKNYEIIKAARRGTERQWYLNLAYYFGQQNVVVTKTQQSSVGFRLNTPPAPPWRVRLVINHVRRIVRKEMASLFGQKPNWEVVPSTTSDEDLVAARAAEQIFDSVYDSENVQTRLKEAGWWACITGTGFIKDYWNANAKDAQGVQGKICIEALTPFHLYVPDFRATDLEQQPFVIHASTRDPQWVKDAYKLDANPTTTATNSILDDVFLGILGAQQLSANQVLLLECWVKPGVSKLLTNGGVITIAGNQLAQVIEKYPYDHMQFPFAEIRNIPSGKFYGEAMITDLLPVQKEYNRTRSQIVEAKNLLSKPKLLAAMGSIDPNKITSEPGQVILYKLGFQPPTSLQLPELPGYVMEQINQLRGDMDDLSGLHDTSNGQNPNQVTSATALSFLQEQDETMLSDTTDSVESAVQKTGRQVLALASQYWDANRLIKVVGTDEAFDAQEYKGADLRGNLDLRVESGSALPKSKAAKQAFITDLIKMGVVPAQQGLEMLDLMGIDKIIDDVMADKRQAQRENLQMQRNGALPVNEWDNHAMHIQTHNRFRKSQTFDMLDADTKIAFQNHVKTHQAALITQNNGDPTGSGEPDNGLPAQQPQGQPGQSGAPGQPPPTVQPEQIMADPSQVGA